ncbi:MAG: protein kinase domain-containing protein [Planctomycetota bacterium]|jgi:serine/threonine protein kinase
MCDAEEKNSEQAEDEESIPTASFGSGMMGIGEQIGPYKLLSILGEGGCGIVYLAERERPVKRRVALKIIKPGMDTKQVIARFETERQALALLDHPNVAHMFNAETTEAGRPYFVMEYVKGVPLTEHCDRQNLGIEERLGLFLEVCEAVQHAHQKGIIHRDIKPSNILVSVQADKMVPKIIDFGIAKALSQSLTERTLLTEQGQIIGTPEYMSPEQAEMTNQDIDTRSDIYSLGVVLYVLLTGVLPFDPETLREGGPESIRKVIREEQPKTPSNRISTLNAEDSAEVARHRHIDFSTLQHRLRGDLDWITLRALEKDRMRRYGSVGEFAADIRRHLKHELVLARPPSTVYKIKKFIRRNRVTVTAASMVAAALVVGLILSTTLYLQKKSALDALAKLETAVEVDRNLSTAQKLYAEGRYQAALAEIEEHLEHKNVGPKARLLHAHLLFEVGRFSDAEANLKKLLDEQPEVAGAAHYLLARIYAGGDSAKTKEHLQLAESLLPQTAEAYCLRAMTADTPEKIIQWLSKAVQLNPSHYPSRKARALAYYAMKDYRKMEQDVEVIIVMRPMDSLGYALRAIARRETGRFDDAIKDHDRAIKICDIEAELTERYNQRRETYLRMANYRAALQDAKHCIELEPKEFVYRFHVFTGLVSLGDYEAARQEHRKIVGADPLQQKRFEAWAKRYVFKILGAGQPFKLSADITLGGAFSAMQEAADYYRTLEAKATRLVPGVYGQVSWSPDGKQLAYGRSDLFEWESKTLTAAASAISGSSGIEILDFESGRTRLLVSFGKDPAWSPDGDYIAFVREPTRIRGLEEELWIISEEDEEPRWLASGAWPIWASDSRRLFFQLFSPADWALYSIRVDDPAAKPERIISLPGGFPWVSPDERYVAYAVNRELRIVELSSNSVITRWTAPGPQRGMLVRWSPDGKELSVGRFKDSDLGLWIFNVERKEAWHIFDAPANTCIWSPDRSRAVIKIRDPFEEAWLAKLDPKIPTYQALVPALTREEYLRRRLEQTTHLIEIDGLDANNYLSRAIVYFSLHKYEEAIADLEKCTKLVKSSLHPALSSINKWARVYHKQGQEHIAQLLLARGATSGVLILKGWQRSGSNPENYEMFVDTSEKHSGKASAYIKSISAKTGGFGVLMQMFSAADFLGRRIQMSAWMKTQKVRSAHLWMRLDGTKGMLGFDNMSDRPVKGTTEWHKYQITLDVPESTVDIAFGALVVGEGQAWVDDFRFEVVGIDAPSTNMLSSEEMSKEQPEGGKRALVLQKYPVNLDFELGI